MPNIVADMQNLNPRHSEVRHLRALAFCRCCSESCKPARSWQWFLAVVRDRLVWRSGFCATQRVVKSTRACGGRDSAACVCAKGALLLLT